MGTCEAIDHMHVKHVHIYVCTCYGSSGQSAMNLHTPITKAFALPLKSAHVIDSLMNAHSLTITHYIVLFEHTYIILYEAQRFEAKQYTRKNESQSI